ncbi:phosphoethanolamine--lipid A transferase [Xanthomonas nasturtii]|uniref:Phosphoethanolamine--lipid A transferase n=1 Tax=Xanthomonas nasturtii TaxID=1843581 RepID=A0A3E1KEZ1_9XANT|nr:phosphoethanolamine--lipid A transferase [Xanthomonas nasturtii]MCL1500293.1 phosphoethanolamine--lipid A transferase [Xanthomonas nasturtii]MCL1504227.1 phosphoethanolamine--lipid A transferase [Xanthomonas nasturtii]MCL1523073.1 phosphoethanolamine--lipid A transferase [Xanthomonas nasturtii]MCL1530976.1 phosphoethanolamine--lipid A transferase [Xanthomonas nasturtii]MCL1565795.1 phosphoethanolamine--lipid A transferase [Xanthomonas nasturtii]
MGIHDKKHALLKRPRVGPELLVWGTAAYATLVLNGAFWRAISGTETLNGFDGVVSRFCIALIVTALNVILVRFLCTRWTTRPVLIGFVLITATLSYFSLQYGVHFDVGMARNILATDAMESREVITGNLIWEVACVAVLPILVLLYVQVAWRPVPSSLLHAAGTVFVALVVLSVAALAGFKDISPLMRNNREIRHLLAPGNLVASFARVAAKDGLGQYRGPRAVLAPDASLAPAHATSKRPHALVIVVGETVRAQNWGLNGYSRETTPRLSREDITNFRDVRACGSSTAVSLPCMFSGLGRSNYDEQQIERSESLLHVLSRAGVDVGWRDNQGGCKGVCDGLPFESLRDQRDPVFCTDEGCSDQILLKGLQNRINSSNRDVVIVLHQLGNHGPSYFLRYPQRLRKFRPDCRQPDISECSQEEVVNAYDNAVLATDEMVAATINLLKGLTTHDSAMIYLSDHGESLGERNLYLHGMPYAIAPDTQMQVPMVIWLSDGMSRWRGLNRACLEQRARKPASHDNLFHSVLGLMQVESAVYDRRKDVFAGCAQS